MTMVKGFEPPHLSHCRRIDREELSLTLRFYRGIHQPLLSPLPSSPSFIISTAFGV